MPVEPVARAVPAAQEVPVVLAGTEARASSAGPVEQVVLAAQEVPVEPAGTEARPSSAMPEVLAAPLVLEVLAGQLPKAARAERVAQEAQAAAWATLGPGWRRRHPARRPIAPALRR